MKPAAPTLRERLERIYGIRLLFQPRAQFRLIALLIGLVLAGRIYQFVVSSAADWWGYDFSAYWLAARHVLDGLPVYSAEQLAGPFSPQQQFLYLYPPFFAVVMTPLAALFNDYREAQWVWAILGGLIVTGSVIAVARAEGLVGRRQLLLLLGAVFALHAVPLEMFMGNVHILLLGMFSVAWLGIRRGDSRGEYIAGAAIGIAALIKLFPLLIVLWFVATGHRRAAIAAFATAAALALLSLPATGIQQWLDFPQMLANAEQPRYGSTLDPTSWVAEVIDFNVARVVVAVVGVAILLWSARSQPARVSFGVAVMVSLLLVPTLYGHYLAIAVLPIALSVAHYRGGLAPALAYLGIFAAGQLDYGRLFTRALASLGAAAPLAVLLFCGRERIPIERADDQAALRAAPPRAANTAAPSS